MAKRCRDLPIRSNPAGRPGTGHIAAQIPRYRVPSWRRLPSRHPEETNMSNHRRLAVALLCGAGIALSATAAPAMPANSSLKNTAPAATENVRWRGGWGWGLGGFAAGAIIG